MVAQRLSLVLVALLSLMPATALDEPVPVYFVVGRTLVVKPKYRGTITSVIWTYNDDLVVEWNGKAQVPEYYLRFKGRTTLDQDKAQLVIKNVDQADAGNYRVDINGQIQDQIYVAEAINVLPEPRVVVTPLTCSVASNSCVLFCEGPTEKVGPVTYSWNLGSQHNTMNMNLENNQEVQSQEWISCKMTNPVSQEESLPINNPFYLSPKHHYIIGIVLFIVLVLVLGGVGFWKREWIRNVCKGPKEDECRRKAEEGPL